jgi:peptide/nickel transport system permease protein
MSTHEPTATTRATSGRRRVHPLVSYTGRRLLIGAALVLVVSTLVFVATQALGDPARAILGRFATPEALAQLRLELGLDKPILRQYTDWLGGFLQGDLGNSLASGQPVSGILGPVLMNTLALTFAALIVIIPLALVLGIWSGVRAGSKVDNTVSSASLAAIALPEFVVGTLLALLVGVKLGLVPPVSLIPPGESPLRHPDMLVLPVATLTLAGLAYLVRMVRVGVLEVMESEYVQMARLNGVPERRVIWHHALRNALGTTVQVVAATVGWLLAGVAIVEVVFAYPGFGQTTVQAVSQRDIPVVQAAVLFVAVVYIVINLIADLTVILLNPKLRTNA